MTDFLHQRCRWQSNDHRIGIVGNFGIDPKIFEAALDAGVNYVFWTPKMRKVTPVLRSAQARPARRARDGPTFSPGGSPESATSTQAAQHRSDRHSPAVLARQDCRGALTYTRGAARAQG